MEQGSNHRMVGMVRIRGEGRPRPEQRRMNNTASPAHSFRLALSAAAVTIASGHALAIDRSWLNSTGGNWITNANWTPSGFPNNGDTATIALASATPYTVTLSNGVTLADNGAINALTINHPQATLQVNPGAGLNMGTGTINVAAGTFSMGNAQITGTGTLSVSPGALLALNGCTMPTGFSYALNGAVRITGTVQGFTSGGITNNGSMTLTGAGTAWLFTQQPLTNNGTITADGVGGGAAQLSVRLNNTAAGTVNLQTSTSTFGSPQTNSGAFTLAAAKTLTIGSFATVNQNAGTMTINGAYTHQNGAFTMNGGLLNIPAGGSFFKDGGNFNYNGGTITGEPVVRSGSLAFGAGATNAASFRVRGPNGSIGNIPSNVALTVEATTTEPAGTGAIGGFTNQGTIYLIGDAVNTASIASGVGGAFTNRGVIIGKAPIAALDGADGGRGGLTTFGCVLRLNIANEQEARLEAESRVRMLIDVTLGSHVNRGLIKIHPLQGTYLEGSIIWPAGGQQTIVQEAGSIDNQGSCVVGGGNTFTFTGGTCTGNPIVIDGGTLNIGQNAGAGSFFMQGANNVITANTIAANQTVTCGPDVAGSEAGECVWAGASAGQPPTVAGNLNLEAGPTLNTTMTAPNGIFVLPAGAATVRNNNGTGAPIIVTPAPYTIAISDNISLTPGVLNIFTPATLNADLQNLGVLRTNFTFADGRSSDRGATDAPVGVAISRGYTQGSNAALSLLVGGPTPGQTDSLSIAGAATLGGTLQIAPGAGYTPAWGNVFTIMTFASRSGDFSTFTRPTPTDPNLRWWREARAADYRVGVRHVADTNHDGVVNFQDLSNVIANYGLPAPTGSPASVGDANEDGVVNFSDLSLVVGNYGRTAP